MASLSDAGSSERLRLVAPGGVIVLGGLLDSEADDVSTVMAAHGFVRRDARAKEGWTSLACEHAPLRHRA